MTFSRLQPSIMKSDTVLNIACGLLTNFSSSQINETQNQNEVKSCFISYSHLEELGNLVQLDADLFSMRKERRHPMKEKQLWSMAKWLGRLLYRAESPEVACMQWSGTSESNNTVNWEDAQNREWSYCMRVPCEYYAGYDSERGKFHWLPAHQSVSLPSLLPES